MHKTHFMGKIFENQDVRSLRLIEFWLCILDLFGPFTKRQIGEKRHTVQTTSHLTTETNKRKNDNELRNMNKRINEYEIRKYKNKLEM